MKKLALLLALLLIAPSAFGQSVGASQIKKRAAGGLVADSANALTVAPYRASSAPSSPIEGQLWCDTTTTPCTMKSYSGSAWTSPPNSVIQVQATLSTLPTSPTDGQIVWVSSQGRAVVYDATAAKWYYLNETGKTAGADYSVDTVGYSTAFLTPPDTTGSVVAGGAMTVGDHTCAVTYYNEIGGETTPGAGFTGTVGTNKTFALTFVATTTGAFGKRVYCSKANTTTPLFLVASIDDTTTGTYNVTTGDAAFSVMTAPDENFSAPLPAGWIGRAGPTRAYGGCGSTGDGLLCSSLGAVGNPSATNYGPRMAYVMTSDPAGWRATWTITRLDLGFPGRAAGTVAGFPVAALMVDAATPASATSYFSFQYLLALPVGPASTPNLTHGVRATGGGQTTDATAGTSVMPWPPITAMPIYAQFVGRREGTEYSHRFSISGNGQEWASSPQLNGYNAAARPYTTGFGSTFQYPHITFAMEHSGPNYPTTASGIIKITNFRWSSE